MPLFVVASAVDDRWGSLARAAIGGAAAFVGFLVVHLAVPRGMGFGDVRLAGVVGLATGWLGLGHAFVAFFAAFVLGALVGVVAMAVSGRGPQDQDPLRSLPRRRCRRDGAVGQSRRSRAVSSRDVIDLSSTAGGKAGAQRTPK